MALAEVEGAKAAGADVRLRRVAESLPVEVLEKMGAVQAQKAFESVEHVTSDDLVWADGIIWGSPTRYGNVAAQMKIFMDTLGKLWVAQMSGGGLVGKVAAAFTSTASQHGGNETTIVSGFWPFFAHMGLIIVGLPYSHTGQLGFEVVKGGCPYGATTIAGGQGERLPSVEDLAGARYQGEYVAKVAGKLFAPRL